VTLDLHNIEEVALSSNTQIHQFAAKLVFRVRQLQHELHDPNYLYAGTRISRQALICREQDMRKVQDDNTALQVLLKDRDDEIVRLNKALTEAMKRETPIVKV
jgi:environmental stress-induced protein Ves